MKNTILNFRAKWYVFLAMLLLLASSSAYAQQQTITGTIDSKTDGLSIIGATVQLQGTQVGTTTDFDGNFSIKIPKKGGVLVVSYVGYKTLYVPVRIDKKIYKISMAEETVALDDVVVVGYGTMRKKEVTGSVARVGGEDLSKAGTADLGTALQGQIAGVNVQLASGEPGTASNIQIRGLSSISGSNSPLYVVDGIPYEGDPGLSDNEIESIDVLKDAASAAIYGTRGAGGVILITTKKGKQGAMKVSFNAYAGAQMITSTIDLINSQDYIYLKILSNRLMGGSKDTDDMIWSTLQSNQKNYFYDNSLKDVVQNSGALIQNYALNLSGGKEGLTYNLSTSYFDQEGTIMNSNFDRLSARANATFKKDRLTITSILGFKLENRQMPPNNLLYYSYGYKPISNLIDPDADIYNIAGTNSDITNLIGILAKFKEDNTRKTDVFNANLAVNYTLFKGFVFTSRAGMNYSNSLQEIINPLFEVYDQDGNLKSNVQARSGVKNTHTRNTSITWENLFNYDFKYKKNTFKLTGAFSLEKYSMTSYYAQIKDLYGESVGTLGGGTADMLVGSGNNRTTTLVGALGRAQYNYDNRYMLSASIRRDGSSRFASENRWGTFPSVSGGWNISEEKFWTPVKDVVSSLKIRASYGTTGNQNFADYSFAPTVTNRYDYFFGSDLTGGENIALGMTQVKFANPNVQWETTQQVNVGVDASFLNNKLTFNADIYESKKKNMLFPMLVPPTAGTGSNSTVVLNLGDMQNRGIELAVGHNHKVGKVTYGVNATFATNENKVTKMSASNKMYYFSDGSPIAGGNTADRVTAVAEGYPAGAFFVMPTNGIINTTQELIEYQRINKNARMGDLRYVDVNQDGKIDDGDRQYAGHGAPEYELGLNANLSYAGFDLSANFYASLGNEVINGSKIYTYQRGTNKELVYQWSEVNPTSAIAANQGSTHDNYRAYADIWVEDGSFLRLKNLILGYSLPKRMIQKAKLSKCRFYVAGDNLWTLTKYSGYDPEVGSNGLSKRGLDLGTYPISMQVRGGVQIDF